MCRCHHFGLERCGDGPGWCPSGWDAEGGGARLQGDHERGAKGRGGGELWHGNRCDGMGWCWRHCGLQRRGVGAGGSASGVLDKLVIRYDGVAANKAGAEHPLPLCGHCMFIMVIRVNGHGLLANLDYRVGCTC